MNYFYLLQTMFFKLLQKAFFATKLVIQKNVPTKRFALPKSCPRERQVDKLCHSDASLVAAKAFAKKALRADTTLDCSLGRTATVVAQVDPMWVGKLYEIQSQCVTTVSRTPPRTQAQHKGWNLYSQPTNQPTNLCQRYLLLLPVPKAAGARVSLREPFEQLPATDATTPANARIVGPPPSLLPMSEDKRWSLPDSLCLECSFRLLHLQQTETFRLESRYTRGQIAHVTAIGVGKAPSAMKKGKEPFRARVSVWCRTAGARALPLSGTKKWNINLAKTIRK